MVTADGFQHEDSISFFKNWSGKIFITIFILFLMMIKSMALTSLYFMK